MMMDLPFTIILRRASDRWVSGRGGRDERGKRHFHIPFLWSGEELPLRKQEFKFAILSEHLFNKTI